MFRIFGGFIIGSILLIVTLIIGCIFVIQEYGLLVFIIICILFWLIWIRIWRVPSSRTCLEQAENALLNRIENRNIEIKNIRINSDQVKTGYFDIHTVIIKNKKATQERQSIVLIHGLGAGNGIWNKNFESLSENFDVYAIDLPGFGLSSSPNLFHQNATTVLSFWTESIRLWCENMKLSNIILCGHSLGSLISTQVSLEYPSLVSRLILCAPVGIQSWKHKLQNLSIHKKVVLRILRVSRMTRSKMLHLFGPFSKRLLKRILRNKQKWYGFDDLMIEYAFHLTAMKGIGENMFLNLVSLKDGWIISLEHRFCELHMPCLIVFGQKDFVDVNYGDVMREKISGNVDLFVIEKAGHHFYTSHSSELNTIILSFLNR